MKDLVRVVLPCVVFALAGSARAELHVANIFSDNMVLQRDKPIRIWGWAKPKDRVRVTLKFNPERDNVQVKSEAQYGGPGNWVLGYDSQLISTLKTDLMGQIGRVTR